MNSNWPGKVFIIVIYLSVKLKKEVKPGAKEMVVDSGILACPQFTDQRNGPGG